MAMYCFCAFYTLWQILFIVTRIYRFLATLWMDTNLAMAKNRRQLGQNYGTTVNK